MKYKLIAVIVTLALTSPAIHAVEPEDPTVIFDTDFALPSMPVGDGLGTPVCIDDSSGLLVAGCDGVVGPQGEPGNLALAGESCPNGEFLSGFDEIGNILCSPAVAQCGNGLIETGEVCDDGNNLDGDGCSFNCLSAETCPDGIINQLTGEECDDGNSDNNDACLNTCQLAQCGDEFIRIGLEECDDGNLDDTDACLSTCTLASCGDGYVRTDVEECDDGNLFNGDGCNEVCQVEDPCIPNPCPDGYTCTAVSGGIVECSAP